MALAIKKIVSFGWTYKAAYSPAYIQAAFKPSNQVIPNSSFNFAGCNQGKPITPKICCSLEDII